jgi:cytoskeletal protein CcmA (bactofilin family)
MSSSDNQTVLINSIIGEGARFNGEIKMEGLLRIDGDFTGNIDINGKVLVGRTGRAECNIFADTIVVGGAIKGDLYSNGKVVLLSTGMVIGNVHSSSLEVEEGVILQGNCVINKDKKIDRREAQRLASRDYRPNWGRSNSSWSGA